MATQVQFRRGSSTENDAFTGALAEITVDTTNKVIRIHDGSTAGGFVSVGTTTTQTLTNKTLSAPTLTGTTSAVTLVATNLSSANAVLTGGSLNNAVIGNTTAAAATVTTLTASGVVSLTSNTQATSTSTGAVQLTGGLSINTGNLFVGGSGGRAITVTGNIVPSANLVATNNLGSDTLWWNNFYGVSTQARYADLAENYQADNNYEAGTVLVFGGDYEVSITTLSHDTRVAGVVSKNPAHLMNSQLTGNGVVPLALTGRVPCKVLGPVAKGDLLVTSVTPGVAQRLSTQDYSPGCVIGKSLDVVEDSSIQTIEVVVGRF